MSTSFLLGYIPKDWSGNSDGEPYIHPEDSVLSRTKVIEYVLDDDGATREGFGEPISWEDIFSEMSADSKKLSGGESHVKAKVFENIHEICLEEAEKTDKAIIYFEYNEFRIDNEDEKYNGFFFMQRVDMDEDDPDATEQKLFIVKP
jgi:hypothetical protein